MNFLVYGLVILFVLLGTAHLNYHNDETVEMVSEENVSDRVNEKDALEGGFRGRDGRRDRDRRDGRHGRRGLRGRRWGRPARRSWWHWGPRWAYTPTVTHTCNPFWNRDCPAYLYNPWSSSYFY